MSAESKSQIYAALIGAAFAMIIAVGGFLWQNGQLNGHLDSLEYREQRIELKVDAIAEDMVELRERTARIEEHIRASYSSARHLDRPGPE